MAHSEVHLEPRAVRESPRCLHVFLDEEVLVHRLSNFRQTNQQVIVPFQLRLKNRILDLRSNSWDLVPDEVELSHDWCISVVLLVENC